MDIVVSEGVPLADAPRESVDAVEIVDDNDRLLVDERGSLLVPVGVCDGLCEELAPVVTDAVGVCESDAVFNELAPTVTEAVGVSDADAELVTVVVGL